jgi:hypothetical protein
MKFRAAILLAAMLMPVAGVAAAPSDRAKAPKAKAAQRSPPMIFYLAKGEDGTCGPGCSEWIAAEGQIEAGTAQQLRTFLNHLGKRKLPIFFHSPGGNVQASTVMGRLLRERAMTAGVSETLPAGCVGASERACRVLKQSKQALSAMLNNVAACNSACVFALIGAKVRQVPPGARLGVHSSRVVIIRRGGGKINASKKQIASLQRTKLAEMNAETRRYVQQMKIDVRLFDLAAKIPFENVHYLTREEIVSFGIDVRRDHEAPWVAAEFPPQRLWTMKFFIAARGEGGNELRSSMIRMECASQRYARISYFRGLGSGEFGVKRAVALTMAERRVALFGVRSLFKFDVIEAGTSFELWGADLPLEALERAGALGQVEIVETDLASAASRVTRLSTAGMSQAIDMLRGHCSKMPDCPQVGAWPAGGTAGAPLGGWAAGALMPKVGTASTGWGGDAASLNCTSMQVR